MTIIMNNKPPPKKMGGVRAKRPNSPVPVTPIKPRQQSGETKLNCTTKLPEKHKARHLKKSWQDSLADYWNLFRAFYHNPIDASKLALWIALKHHDELIQIGLLLIAMFLEYRLHAAFLLHH